MRALTIAALVTLVPAGHFADAQSLDSLFPAGAGSRFAFLSPMVKGELVVSIAASSEKQIVLECFFSAAGTEMWEQFTIDLSSGTPSVSSGYILTGGARVPEQIPSDMLRGLDAVDLADFLIADRAQIERYKKGDELLRIPASRAPVQTSRYEHNKSGQTITYWLSDAVRPLRIARIESKGNKTGRTYKLDLLTLMRNVGRKIDPTTAVPMSPQTREWLLGQSR